MLVKIILIFNVLILNIKCLYYYIESKEKKCVNSYHRPRTSLIIYFSISGREEFDNLITIEDPTHFEMYIARDSYQRKITLPVDQGGRYYFCIENFSKSQIKVNILFQDEKFKTQMGSIKNIRDFLEGISDLTNQLQIILFNIKNSAIRRQAHFMIAQNLRNEINLIAILKIIIIVFLSGIELRMISSILNNNVKVKRINVNTESQPLKQGEKKYGDNYL